MFFFLKASGSCNQSKHNCINYELIWDLHNSLLMRGQEFTCTTEVENTKCTWRLRIDYNRVASVMSGFTYSYGLSSYLVVDSNLF